MTTISETAIQTKRYSYTALSQFENCPFSFFNKYVKRRYPDEDTLPLALGNLLHKARELCSISLMNGKRPDYSQIENIVLHEGWSGIDKASANGDQPQEESLRSIDILKRQFFDDWLTVDEKSGLSYDQKLRIFFEHLSDEETEWKDWQTIGAEVAFSFEIRPGIIIRGLIDKVQRNPFTGKIRIVDYKSSKAVYDSKKLATPLQLYIYHLACQHLYPDYEIEAYLYDFILLGQQQAGGTKGWITRAEKKLNKLLDAIEECEATGIWAPKPSPLCYWCSYCETNPNADAIFKTICPYYSYWTPNDRKNFDVHTPWSPDDVNQTDHIIEERQAVKAFRW